MRNLPLWQRIAVLFAALFAVLIFIVAVTPTEETEPPAVTSEPFPLREDILAADISGGWLNIDFLSRDDPLQEAKQCVKLYVDVDSAEAVACYAFVSQAAYEASEPESAGNFKGFLCWDASWLRNKLGDESGDGNPVRDASCPD